MRIWLVIWSLFWHSSLEMGWVIFRQARGKSRIGGVQCGLEFCAEHWDSVRSPATWGRDDRKNIWHFFRHLTWPHGQKKGVFLEGFWSISCAESWPSWFIRVGDLDIDYIFKCSKSSRFHNIQREMLSMFDWFGKPTVLGIPPRFGSKFGKHPVDIHAFGWKNHEKTWFPVPSENQTRLAGKSTIYTVLWFL